MRTLLVVTVVWAGVLAALAGLAVLVYAWEEYQWRRDEKRGEQRLLLLVNLQQLDERTPPHLRRHFQ